jgi:hypothetical protein
MWQALCKLKKLNLGTNGLGICLKKLEKLQNIIHSKSKTFKWEHIKIKKKYLSFENLF